jgi:soluble lytic murein transglycosylase-like protein
VARPNQHGLASSRAGIKPAHPDVASAIDRERGRSDLQAWRHRIRRGALVVALGCPLTLMPWWGTGGAMADGTSGPGTEAEPPGEPAPKDGEAGETPVGETPVLETPTSTTTTPPGKPSAGATSSAPPTSQAPPSATDTPSAAGAVGAAPGQSSPAAPAEARAGNPSRVPDVPTVKLQRHQKGTPGRAGERATAIHAKPKPVGSGSVHAKALRGAGGRIALPPQLLAAQAGELWSELASSAASLQALSFYRIPLFLLPIYKAAEVEYGVPWQVLAAINEVETDYGSDLSVSSAGAVGWMQFMPATWMEYGVDSLNTGYADPYNPVDAIFAAARYLRAAGARTDLSASILAYNHSSAYLRSVLLRAKLISAYPQRAIQTLTGLTDAREPVRDRHLHWDKVTVRGSVSSATAHASPVSGKQAAAGRVVRRPGVAPPPTALTAQMGGATTGQQAELLSDPHAAVVAVQDARVLTIGRSRALGRFIVLRDVYGDRFTYSRLGSLARTYPRPKPSGGATHPDGSGASTAPRSTNGGRQDLPSLPTGAGADLARGGVWSLSTRPDATNRTDGKVRLFAHPDNPDALATAARTSARRRHHGPERLPLRVGSAVPEGTVLGSVYVPRGAKDGHMRFAIEPAGDSQPIDPLPILSSWRQLDRALHPHAAKGAAIERILKAAAKSGLRSARGARTSPAAVLRGQLSPLEWDRLMARIAGLPSPLVAVRPSNAAVTDR